MIFMIGWALGGILFGVLGDRLGRAKTMMLTILCYTIFTGLGLFATGVWDFNVYRFLCGLGVGGQFAVGVALVAEVIPARARPHALGMVQACSAVGNMLAALIGIWLGQSGTSAGAIAGAWRYMFLAGALPAPLALVVFKKLKEPEQWLKARAERSKLGSLQRVAIPSGAATPSSVCCWPSPAWSAFGASASSVTTCFARCSRAPSTRKDSPARRWPAKSPPGSASPRCSRISAASWACTRSPGSRSAPTGATAFAVSFMAAMLTTAYTFWNLRTLSDIFWMIPLMGFSQLALFGGYAIYLPELFPTRLRSTGTSFCYNVGRLVAAGGPAHLGPAHQPRLRRYAGAHALRRRHHVPGIFGRLAAPPFRAGNQRQAAARIAQLRTR